MSLTQPINEFSFEITATAGDARTGEFSVDNTTLQTPNLFPVLNFYAGGMERSVFGGGIHRTVKEILIGADRVGGESLSEYFDGVMTSVSSLTDYNVTRERYNNYLDTPIKQRDIFRPLSGMVFVDSGGFKFLSGSKLDGSDFEVEMDQTTVYEVQRKMGGDIIVNLDHPISPDDNEHEREQKAKKTAENIHKFLSLTRDFEGALFFSLHGHNYSKMKEYLVEITKTIPIGVLQEGFDGVALGGLVPKKDNRSALIQAVTDCREIMREYEMSDWPLHILGISSGSIPLLVALGADSFDSSTYLFTAMNGKYSTSLIDTVPISEADFSQCDCPVCQSDQLVSWMQGNTEYQKDIVGPVAMHNLIVQKRELAHMRRRIQEAGTGGIIEYIEELYRPSKSMRPFAHQVVNQSLGGYF